MKKQLSLLAAMVAVFGMSPAFAAVTSGASTADLTGAPGTRARTAVDYNKYETRSSKTSSYTQKDNPSIYYTQPARKSDLYKQTGTASSSVRTTRTETVRNEAKRKYYLAHPFFQPTKGKFGSVTDLSYTMSSYDVDITTFPSVTIGGTSYNISLSDNQFAWDSKQFSIKEDLSFGITDTLAVMGMIRYDSTKSEFDWANSPDDKDDNSGLNLFGLGMQWRFADNADWIATLSGYYQHQKDIADYLVLDLKAGYKVGTSTIYGLARGWYASFDGNMYGNGFSNDDITMILAYQHGDDSAFFIEGGIGVFSVVDEDWTLNLEAVFGDYDWHTQGSIKGAIGWQPGNNFALNLYIKTAFYDSADDKKLGLWWYEPNATPDPIPALANIGTAKVSDYAETSFGLQAIFYF